MDLIVDVGNSRTTLALFKDNAIQLHWAIDTHTKVDPSYYERSIADRFLEHGIALSSISGVTLSSVVPNLTLQLRETLKTLFKINPAIVQYGVLDQVVSLTDDPSEMGSDLYCNALAAHMLIGKPAVIVDLGTALTFLVIRDGKILGVAIAPGIRTSLNSLYLKTAQLPDVPLQKPKSSIGKNTNDAIIAGVIGGYIGLIKSKLADIKSEFGSDLYVVVTGGYSNELLDAADVFDHIDPMFTLRGIQIYGEQVRKG